MAIKDLITLGIGTSTPEPLGDVKFLVLFGLEIGAGFEYFPVPCGERPNTMSVKCGGAIEISDVACGGPITYKDVPCN